jgi:hypothetical protein
MKMVGGFFLGIFVCLLVVAAIGYFTSSARAEDAPANDLGLNGLMPDVGSIYREALGGPYRQVESEITDPDIARYYRSLMEKTGLDKIGAE